MTDLTIPIRDRSTLVGELIPLRPEFAEILAYWRDEHAQWFLTSFEMDVDRTRSWLEKGAASGHRMLFGVQPEGENIVGVVGLTGMDMASGSAELDHVLRGTDCAPGIMHLALESLLAWASESGYSKIRLRVFQDNPAARFYEKIGFVRQGLPEPLREVKEASSSRWVESSDKEPERFLIHMVLPKAKLLKICSKYRGAVSL